MSIYSCAFCNSVGTSLITGDVAGLADLWFRFRLTGIAVENSDSNPRKGKECGAQGIPKVDPFSADPEIEPRDRGRNGRRRTEEEEQGEGNKEGTERMCCGVGLPRSNITSTSRNTRNSGTNRRSSRPRSRRTRRRPKRRRSPRRLWRRSGRGDAA